MEQLCLLPVVHNVAPLLAKERAEDPDGLWATKQYGDLKVREDTGTSRYVRTGALCALRSTLLPYPHDSSCTKYIPYMNQAYEYESVLVYHFEGSSLTIARRAFTPPGSTPDKLCSCTYRHTK